MCVGTTILSEATRDASGAPPGLWKLPDLWTQRTRPQVFAKPQTVSHSSHTLILVLFHKNDDDRNPSESLVRDPQILRRRQIVLDPRCDNMFGSSSESPP